MKGKRRQQQKSRKAKSLIFEQDGGLVDCTTPPRSESGRAPFPQAAPLCRPLLLSSLPSQVTAFLSLFFSNWSRLLQKSQGETSSSKSSTIIITFALIMDKVISTIKNSPIYFNSARAGPSCVCGIARESSSRESRDFRTEISAYRADRHYALRVS